ncbi:MAG: DUF4177 domain-containing protein [Deltaproteobacteria bacterium]|nr:DUF4177 domain-containing protein [Deltaproteobacteria bacterium]
MVQYKCVPAPKRLVINKQGNYDDAIRSFADLINQEAKEGWKFHSMENIGVTQKSGCIGGLIATLFGRKSVTTYYFNMLIFMKD